MELGTLWTGHHLHDMRYRCCGTGRRQKHRLEGCLQKFILYVGRAPRWFAGAEWFWPTKIALLYL